MLPVLSDMRQAERCQFLLSANSLNACLPVSFRVILHTTKTSSDKERWVSMLLSSRSTAPNEECVTHEVPAVMLAVHV